MTQAAPQSTPLASGIVESISKSSIILSHNNGPVTLSGPNVEAISSKLKLGDVVEFAINDDSITVQLPASKKTGATSSRRQGNSPAGCSIEQGERW